MQEEICRSLRSWRHGPRMRTSSPCALNGRVYRDAVIEETGTAPVAFRVDVAAGPIADAIRVHWNLSA